MIARAVIALASGLIFGAGLALSGMMNPARVRGFLDIFGAWDPTLAFVMGGAVLVMALAWPLARKVHGEEALPQAPAGLDRRLIGGAVLFGIGWGLAGLCPGPALASLGTAIVPALVFTAAMLTGMAIFRFTLDRG